MAQPILTAAHLQNEEAAFAFLEARVWPNGPVCPHCGAMGRIKKLAGKTTRVGLHKCYDCMKPFTVKVGTVFESSHVPLHLWLQAAHLLCSSKKGISSNQLHRTLGVTLKTAWLMSHRLREAMTTFGAEPMGGEGAIVEIDETFIGNKKDMPIRRSHGHKHAVMTLIERGPKGGRARSFHVEGTAAADLLPIIKTHVSSGAHVMTDEAGQYAHLGKRFTEHDFTMHGKGEYVRGAVHINTVEGFYSVFKRRMTGVYQHCSEGHLHRYVAEFDFRYNNRVRLGIDDAERTDNALRGIVGKRLTYRTTRGARPVADRPAKHGAGAA
jgi:transposase-like protein